VKEVNRRGAYPRFGFIMGLRPQLDDWAPIIVGKNISFREKEERYGMDNGHILILRNPRPT